jgi:hypothetical protein
MELTNPRDAQRPEAERLTAPGPEPWKVGEVET